MTTDTIQMGILIATFLGAIVALSVGSMQLHKQNKVNRYQLIKSIFDMYQSVGQTITDELIDHFDLYHYEYMDSELYQKKYRGKKDRIRTYVWIGEYYELLAFVYSLKELMRNEIVNERWIKNWLADLKDHDEFDDVDEAYKKFYTHFSVMAKTVKKRNAYQHIKNARRQ